MKTFLKISLYLLVAFIVACSSKKEAPIEAPLKKAIPVKVEEITATDEPLPIMSSGMLDAKEEIKLSFKIGGVVSGIFANEGQYVKKGTLLAKLEQQEIASQVIQAQAGLEKAKRDVERAETLFQDTVVTLEQVQNARTALEVAKANVEIATFNQQYATIYAPVSGKIVRKLAEKNEVISPGNPVLMLAASDKAPVVRVGLADKDVVKLAIGDTAHITFDAYQNQIFKAKVSEIAASATQGIGTFEVELMVNEDGYDLKQGFVGKVAIFPSTQAPYYKVPVSAIFEADKKTVYVFVPDARQEKVKKIALQTQGMGENFLIVSKGKVPQLSHIITEGNAYLKNGSAIIPQVISSEGAVVGK